MEVVDTSIFIDHLRGHRPATDFFNSATELLFSALTEVELLTGKSCDNAEKREGILQFLKRWEKIEVDNPIAVIAGDLRRKHDITISDAIIAATALVRKATLLTRDVNDFKSIQGLTVRSLY
ncbi:MAG TPA: type II toxin-antitoxin system VapC family toxin [Candidatus Nanoarchaeia archaeon]|nr:type II toxin-antitoxin system VapC family toxin [Candidatus Nanoarchaeia archaeon]